MSKLLRYYKEGNVYFITVVTNNREKILVDNQDLLRDSIRKYEMELKFSTIAWVILADHFHMIIDPKKKNLSSVIQKIKLSFSKKFRYNKGETSGYVWQNRFWDHAIRNQTDMNNHIDYIHYNPVKHGYVRNPFRWILSSIHDYARLGYYADDWGVSEELKFDGEFGE